jgi:lipoprotein-anchoring transpeptidase ErfK/SrfK
MRATTLLSAALAAAVIGSLAFAPKAAQAHGTIVAAPSSVSAGTIVVRTNERRLYYVIGYGQAIRYPVGVGRAGQQWSGTSVIDAKYVSPDWAPPPDIRAENPKLPLLIPGGSPHNPMGVAAMTLSGLDYAIHGTNQPSSIGHFVSHGCIRMLNEDVTDLFGRVGVGTPVVVIR